MSEGFGWERYKIAALQKKDTPTSAVVYDVVHPGFLSTLILRQVTIFINTAN